ncbi:MAG: SAM-dependent methyltransferase [Planctomycetota bacterium]|jgi:SAM-dependent methyltransferase
MTWRNAGGPLHYIGSMDERREHLGSQYVISTCGSDTTGEVEYAYNSLGFRGPEFRRGARLRIYTFGESDAFGLGVDVDSAWPNVVVDYVRSDLGLLPDQICHMNFAEPGGSNDLIARMVLTQCGEAPPDLVLVNFAETDRAEGVCRGRVFSVGPWFNQSQKVRDRILKLPPDESQSHLFVEALRRGDGYLEFTNFDHSRLAALRNMLLVQSYLKSAGIPAVATSRPLLNMTASEIALDPLAGPLIEQVRDDFYFPFDWQWPPLDFSAEGVHMGPRSHARIAAQVFECLQGNGALDEVRRRLAKAPTNDSSAGDASASASAVGGVGVSTPGSSTPGSSTPGSSTPESSTPGVSIAASVRGFYEDMPFSMHGDVSVAAASVRDHSLAAIYPDLHALLRSGSVKTVLEFGCGAGWLAATMAHHYGVEVTAVDFTAAALQRARAVAESLKVADRIQFVHSDLFEYEHGAPVDLVVSVGVLHHTRNARAAFQHASASVTHGGSIFVGLYHEPGRAPFLELFRGIAAAKGEDAALAEYAKLDGVHAGDKSMLKSWFRDQVLHPHETQHTLREVCGWLAEDGLCLRSTSVNRFAAIERVESLFELEQTFGERSRQANITEGRYFPGFFTVLARRE